MPSRYLILVGDGLHNFIDGVAIAASFAASPELGLATTSPSRCTRCRRSWRTSASSSPAATAYGKALLLNFLSGLTAILGAYLFFALGDVVEHHLAWFMTATAGMFIYIAGSDLIPQVHHHRAAPGALVYLPFLGGIVVIAALAALLGH